MERLRAIPHAPLMSKEVVEFNLQRDPNDWPFDSIVTTPIDLAPVDPTSKLNLDEGNDGTNIVIVKLPPQPVSEVTPSAVSENEGKNEATVSDDESTTEATAERLPLREVAHNSRLKPTLLKDNGSDVENKENAPMKRLSSSPIIIFEDPGTKDTTEQRPISNRYQPDKLKQAEKAAKRAEEKRRKNAERKSAKEAERAEKLAKQKAEEEAAVDKISEVVAAQPMHEDSASKHTSKIQGGDCVPTVLTTAPDDQEIVVQSKTTPFAVAIEAIPSDIVGGESVRKDQSQVIYPLFKQLRSHLVLESAVDRYDCALAEGRAHPGTTDPAYECTLRHAGEILMKRLCAYLDDIKNIYADILLPQLQVSWDSLGDIRKCLQFVDKKAATVVEENKGIQTLEDDGAIAKKEAFPNENEIANPNGRSAEIEADSRAESKAILPDLDEEFDEDGNFISDVPQTKQDTDGCEDDSDRVFSCPVHRQLLEVYESGNGNPVTTPTSTAPLNHLGRRYAPNKSSRLARFQMLAVVEERGPEEVGKDDALALNKEQSVFNNSCLTSAEDKSGDESNGEMPAVGDMDIPTATTTYKATAVQLESSIEERDALIEASATHQPLGKSKEFHGFEVDAIPARTHAMTVVSDSCVYQAVSIEELKEASRKLRMPAIEESKLAAKAQTGRKKGKSKKRAQKWLPFNWAV